MKLTSHSFKATCLSIFEAVLLRTGWLSAITPVGYVWTSGLCMALTYSRDGASRPLAILCAVLREIRHGVYKPDETQSGRLVSELDVTDKTDLSKQRVIDVALQETEPERPFPELAALPDPPAEGEEDLDHITTDSSSDTEPETVVKPARYARPFLCPEGTMHGMDS